MNKCECSELIDLLREERPAFAEDLDNGVDLIAAHDGHFVAWDEIIDQCKQGLEDVGYSQSPAELISRIINERDELTQQVCDECSPDNYGWVFNSVEIRGACTCMIEAEPFQILLKALEKLSRLGNGDQLGNSEGNCIAIEALRAVLPLDYQP